MPEQRSLTIGQVAQQAGLRASAIRYYESVGVLPAPERIGGKRRYDEEVLRRLAVVRTAQEAGFSLPDITALLDAPSASESVRSLAQRKLVETEALIGRLQAVTRWLRVAAACDCPTLDVCTLFDAGHVGRDESKHNAPMTVVKIRGTSGGCQAC